MQTQVVDFSVNATVKRASFNPRFITDNSAKTCAGLLAEFSPAIAESSLLRFRGVGDRDVYNITAPFVFDGHRLIAGRVEHRSTEISQIVLFRENDGYWDPYFSSPMLRSLQDPCVTIIGDELILGGVRYPVQTSTGDHSWRTEFFRGRSLAELRHFLSGPMTMKDIRLCGLPDGRIAVLTRPQGPRGGRGKIGFTIAASLDHISPEMIDRAPILPGQFGAGEWGGANEAHLLSEDTLGVLGHIAYWDRQGNRHYFPMAFTLNIHTHRTTPLRIIAKRSLFPDAPAKRADLADVVFSGGLVRHGDGAATLYAGLSDAAAGMVRISDPFASTFGI